MEEDKIKYSDLVSPDDSIKTLIGQLESLNSSYTEMIGTIKTSAKDIISQMKAMSTATSDGRQQIDEATAAANRLERAQKELKFAMSDTGKEVAWLKAQVASHNKMSVEQQRLAQSLAGSYDKIKQDLKEQISLWKGLSQAERSGAFGKDLLDSIDSTRAKLKILDEQLKDHVTSITAVEKAKQKLAYLRSAEGQRLLELKRLINEEISASRTQKATLDEVAQAQERLNAARAATRQQVYELNIQTKEANRIAKLQAQLNLSEEGSYNKLAAQYELNKIKLNAMSAAERQGTETGKMLEKETLALYIQMQKLQEATGNHRLSVGNYAKSWDGLGISVSQVVRELPAVAVSMNTFFLGISNNIPILIDEINKLRAENKQLIAEGKQTKSVVGSIARAFFSWNTILVVGLTILSMHGKAIIDWIGNLINGKKEAMSYSDAIKNINAELEKTNGSYGQNVATIKKLSNEWKNLTSKKEQLQWIKDNKSEFDRLDISVRNVSDAENIFVENTQAMIEALKLRARAAAAMKLAADSYEKALKKQVEAEQEEYNFEKVVDKKGNVSIKRTKKKSLEPSILDAITPGFLLGDVDSSFDLEAAKKLRAPEMAVAVRINSLKQEEKALETEADIYAEIANNAEKAAAAKLKEAGIDSAHKYDKNRTRTPRQRDHRTRTPRQRDLTDQIWRNDLQIRKKYELSISALQRDEFNKRRIEAIDATNATIREMQEKFRKNEVFLTNPDNKFKPLTPEQRTQIEQQQKEIQAIIENAQRKLEIDLQQIEDERQVASANKLRQVMQFRVDTIAKSLEDEKKLRIKQLEELESAYSTSAKTSEGGELIVQGSLTPEQIAEFQRKRQQIEVEYDQIIYNMKKADIEAQLELVKKGSDQELELLLRRNEIARQLALAENRAKPIEQRQDESQINAQFDKRGKLAVGAKQMTDFDDIQAAQEASFNIIRRSEYQITDFKLKAERDRWKKQIELAEAGALDWSEAQIAEAKSMIAVIDREISENSDFFGLVGDKGLGGALLIKLGFNDKQIDALSEAASIVIDNIKAIADAEVEAAEQAVAAAERRVEAAQKAYDAETEGRNNGYANNVATAKKELQQEKKNQQQKQKMLEEAQRRQEAINTVVQASSLVTASANLWASLSPIPIVGPSLALAAIATMWGSFAAAKIRAAQVTRAGAEEQYGEGGLEILEGGSHASGNDIDLQTKNSKGRNMRAEGGEAMAIINKRNTRKYRKILPTIVDSINKGTFEEKFSQAFKTGDELSQNVTYENRPVDLSQLEDDVRALKHNSEQQMNVLPNGTIVIRRKNVTRFIH